MYCDQRSQYIRQKSKKNSFRGNYMRKYGTVFILEKCTFFNFFVVCPSQLWKYHFLIAIFFAILNNEKIRFTRKLKRESYPNCKILYKGLPQLSWSSFLFVCSSFHDLIKSAGPWASGRHICGGHQLSNLRTSNFLDRFYDVKTWSKSRSLWATHLRFWQYPFFWLPGLTIFGASDLVTADSNFNYHSGFHEPVFHATVHW